MGIQHKNTNTRLQVSQTLILISNKLEKLQASNSNLISMENRILKFANIIQKFCLFPTSVDTLVFLQCQTYFPKYPQAHQSNQLASRDFGGYFNAMEIKRESTFFSQFGLKRAEMQCQNFHSLRTKCLYTLAKTFL